MHELPLSSELAGLQLREHGLIDVGPELQEFGRRPLVIKHRLHELEMFDDNTLVDLLDGYPREHLQVFTMGVDPCRPEEWALVDAGDLSGRELFRALRKGRLWYNLRRVDVVEPQYRALVNELYRELEQNCPGFHPEKTSATLIISSPGAMVYYHIDAPANLLWHIKGKKRIWIYPPCDSRFISQDLMEEIMADAVDENIPYSTDFDGHAEVFDLRMGEMASWPLNSPHRVSNLDTINVSISTYHATEMTERRRLTYLANRFLRRRFGASSRSTRESGGRAFLKRMAYRVINRAGLDDAHRGPSYTVTLRVDPDSPDGISPLD